ncbi:MAG: T9SS type A sorting domain-containing protein [Candidatus Krumholzibacteria bacterium]|nr:T9SS type A sorting domain-containing protein [Candidatus Krumholzibacteria bacterium]
MQSSIASHGGGAKSTPTPVRARITCRRRNHIVFLWAATLCILSMSMVEAQELTWTRQFGSASSEHAFGVAVGPPGIFVVGQIQSGSLPGETSAGGFDCFIRKYASDGVDMWTRQFGTSSSDHAYGAAVNASGVYVAGRTLGEFDGQSRSGGYDAVIRMYNHDGTVEWTRQFGSPHDDEAYAIAVHESGVYVAGWANGTLPGSSSGRYGAFVSRFDPAGNVIWIQQFGASSVDRAHAVAVDGSGVYVTGYVSGTLDGQVRLGGKDAYIRKYDLGGTPMWTRQFGTPGTDAGLGVAVDASGVYIVGKTSAALPGQLHSGDSDGFICKYDVDGNESWTRQFGSAGAEEAFAAAVDASGVYVAGRTSDVLSGEEAAGTGDAFVVKFDPEGNEMWARQFGSSSRDDATTVSCDASGAFVAGFTDGTLPEQTTAGLTDAFVARLGAPEEEPPAIAAAMIDVLPGSCPSRFNVTWRNHMSNGHGKNGKLPVALVGSEDFDVSQVDPATLLLQGVAPIRWALEDAVTPMTTDGECACTTDGADGFQDLVLKFYRIEIADALGSISDREMTGLTLTGQMMDGTPFEAYDCVEIMNNNVVLGTPVPNPFNPVTQISFVLQHEMNVVLSVYDVSGRLVDRIAEGRHAAGEHSFPWDADGFASGTYFFRLRAGSTVETRSVILLK